MASETDGGDGCKPPQEGPWWLKVQGVWGMGRRSVIRVDDVHVVDLGAPADVTDGPHANDDDVTSVIFEAEEPAEGMDVEFERFALGFQSDDGSIWLRPHD